MAGRWLACVVLLGWAAGVQGQVLAFRPGVQVPVGAGPLAVAAGDFHGNGKMDLAVADATAGTVAVLAGHGDGTFAAPGPATAIAGECQPNLLVAGDFNQDGKLDVLVSCAGQGRLVVLPGHGDGTFGAPLISNTGSGNQIEAGNFLEAAVSLAVGNFHGNGKLDVAAAVNATATGNASLYLFAGRGDGTFPTWTAIDVGAGSPAAVVEGDFNGDGKPDLAVLLELVTSSSNSLNATLQIELGNGKGGFTRGNSYAAGSVIDLRAADVNGDGIEDILAYGPLTLGASGSGNATTGFSVFLGTGGGAFNQYYSDSEKFGDYALGVALADVRGTGKPDLLEAMSSGTSTNFQNASGKLYVRENDGTGRFLPPQEFSLAAGELGVGLAVGNFGGVLPDVALIEMPAAGIAAAGAAAQFNQGGSFVPLPAGQVQMQLNLGGAAAGFSNVNGASFAGGAVAQDSIVSAFGNGMAPGTAEASTLPLPAQLEGVSVTVSDAAGSARTAPLFYVSPGQINYAMPAGTAAGLATITITGGGQTFAAQQQVAAVAPGLFAADGLAVGQAVNVVNGVQTTAPLVQADASGHLLPVPVDVSQGQAVLVLYGTGIRHHAGPVTASIGSLSGIAAAYAGAQGTFTGEDQVNIPLPAGLKGAGYVELRLQVDGALSNVVSLAFK